MFDFNRSFKSTKREDKISTKRFGSHKLTVPKTPAKVYSSLLTISNDNRNLPKITDDYPKTSKDFQKILGMFGQTEVGKRSGKLNHFLPFLITFRRLRNH